MMKRLPSISLLIFSLVCLASVCLTGCAGRFERPKIPNVIAVPAVRGVGNYTLEKYEADLLKYDTATADAAKVLRNKMVYELLAEIDYVFYDYETKLFVNQSSFNVASDFLQLGLAAGATVTNGARGKTILSALLSGVTGTSLSIDKNFFRQQTVQAIASSMEANRDKIKALILSELSQPVDTYPFAAARAELIQYFFAGTLPNGLRQLHQESAADAERQRTALNAVQVRGIEDLDVVNARELNAGITKAFANGDLTKVTAWLKAMGAVTEETPTRDALETAVRALGRRYATEPELRKRAFAEAKKAGLIQ